MPPCPSAVAEPRMPGPGPAIAASHPSSVRPACRPPIVVIASCSPPNAGPAHTWPASSPRSSSSATTRECEPGSAPPAVCTYPDLARRRARRPRHARKLRVQEADRHRLLDRQLQLSPPRPARPRAGAACSSASSRARPRRRPARARASGSRGRCRSRRCRGRGPARPRSPRPRRPPRRARSAPRRRPPGRSSPSTSTVSCAPSSTATTVPRLSASRCIRPASSATSSALSSASTVTHSSGSWLCAVPFATFRHGSPSALKTFASLPPPVVTYSRLDAERLERRGRGLARRRGPRDPVGAELLLDVRLDVALPVAGGVGQRVDHLARPCASPCPGRGCAPRARAGTARRPRSRRVPPSIRPTFAVVSSSIRPSSIRRERVRRRDDRAAAVLGPDARVRRLAAEARPRSGSSSAPRRSARRSATRGRTRSRSRRERAAVERLRALRARPPRTS